MGHAARDPRGKDQGVTQARGPGDRPPTAPTGAGPKGRWLGHGWGMPADALAMVVASACLHAAWSAAIKGSRDPLGFNVLQTAVAAGAAVVVLGTLDLSEVPRPVLVCAAATGIPHALYFYFLSRAFERGDLSLVYPIVRSTPAFLPLVAVPLLGESVSPLGALGIAVVVGGVWLVQSEGRLRVEALRGPGVGFAALALLATLAYSLLDKHGMSLFAKAPWSSALPKAVVFFFLLYVSTTLVFVPLALPRLSRRSFAALARAEGGRAALSLAVSVVSYGLILEAFRSAAASYVVAVRQSSVIFALVIAMLWLGERPGRARVLGAGATVLGVALVATR